VRLTFANARVWRYVMSGVGKFIETGLLIVGDNGLTFKAMDPSRVSLVEFLIPKESFDEFEVEGEAKITVNVEDLAKILRTSERDDRITLELGESTLSLTFERKGIPRTFIIPLQLGSEAESIPELKLELKNVFKVMGVTLYEGITSIEDVGDVLRFETGESELHMKSVSDLGEAEVIFDLNSGTLLEAEVSEPNISVSYGLEYFSYIKQAIKIAEAVTIMLGSEMPCQLILDLPQGAKMNYYVAPRVD